MPPVPDSIPSSDQQIIRDLLDDKPPEFTDLTLTQYEAFQDGVLDEGNHLVIAETGNGKTFVAEAVTKKAVENGNSVAYLVPSIALVGEKHATISDWASDGVEVNQGHGYTEAEVVVATFESFFEAVIRGYAGRFDTVVLDDFHEIYSPHRGPNIEKAISAALEENMELLAISATVGNPHTIARWMDAELTISTEERAVPISERPVEKSNESYADQIARIIRSNRQKGPFLIFNDTTSNAEARARGVADEITFETGDDIEFRTKVDEAVTTELTESHEQLVRLLNNGIAYHHAQMENGLKELIETYTEEGIIKCVFCTTTLSYGFDSPVQSVIIADLKRWDGVRQFIGIYEYVQWIGRAGRDSSSYNQAYAFPMYDDENAVGRFQFGTSVEDKDLEDVSTHLSGTAALRWLILELVTYGWETDVEVLVFIQSTLFWAETVQQVPQHVQDDYGVNPGQKVVHEVEETFAWLTKRGLLREPVGQPQSEENRYSSTELGTALVEYEHDNWFENTVQSVLELAEWLNEEGDGLTPELLVERLAEEYHYCDEGYGVAEEGQLAERMDLHGLEGTEGTTAVLICWFWCPGVSITDIEDVLNGDDLSGLPNTASNVSDAVDSISHLYTPFEMPTEPEWLDRLSAQIAEGIPGPDMYLVNNVDHFGRRRYNNLEDYLNRIGAGSDWDPGEDHFVVERLSKLLAERQEDLFQEAIQATPNIGSAISENILNTMKQWEPTEADTVEVPFVESARDRQGSADLMQYHDSDLDSNSSSEQKGQSTTLDDF